MKRLILIVLVLFTCSRNLWGQVWTNLIDSVPNSLFQLHTAVVDSSTNTLYLGGYFCNFNQFPFLKARSVMRYNGTTFDTLQTGIDYQDSSSLGTITSMQMFQNKLYVFGEFKKAGKFKGYGIGRWNGSSWDSLNFKTNGYVYLSDVYNSELYIASGFDSIGGVKITGVAKFDGTTWFDLGHPVPGGAGISAIKNYNGKLYMAGMVTASSTNANLSYYDGNKWTPWVGVSGDGNKAIFGMNVIDSMLYVYGRFNSIAGTNCRGLAAYNGNTNKWYGFGKGLSDSSWETIYNVQKVHGDIYVTGNFYTIEDVTTVAGYPSYMKTQIVKLVGDKWCALSEPFDNVVAGVVGYQNNLYAYGPFRQIGNDTLFGFVRWDGGSSTKACSSTFSVNVVDVGVSEQTIFGDMKIFPNPVSEVLTIELSNSTEADLNMTMTNSLGQVIIDYGSLKEKNEINLSSLGPGIYFVLVKGTNGKQIFRIIH